MRCLSDGLNRPILHSSLRSIEYISNPLNHSWSIESRRLMRRVCWRRNYCFSMLLTFVNKSSLFSCWGLKSRMPMSSMPLPSCPNKGCRVKNLYLHSSNSLTRVARECAEWRDAFFIPTVITHINPHVFLAEVIAELARIWPEWRFLHQIEYLFLW